MPALLVHLDERDVRPEREGAVGRVVVRRLVEVRLHALGRPVVEPSGDDEELSVIGGFGAVSYERSEDAQPGQTLGDEQITDLVRRELREDAATIDFDIEVETRNGVVFLRGTVETLDDAENVEAVANRVAGVVDVREELEVISLMNPPLE